MDADDKFQTLVTRVETILAAENVQWAEYTTTAKKKADSTDAASFPAQDSNGTAT